MTSQAAGSRLNRRSVASTAAQVIAAIFFLSASSGAMAQDVRWSWFEVSYVAQDIGEQGTMTDFDLGQSVEVDAQDGDGIQFRSTFGTWHNLFAFIEFNSSDIDVQAVVTNAGGMFPAEDQFDFTAIRGGIGLKWSVTYKTDLYVAASYDSIDFDFGSFAGENFDTGDKDFGGEIGMRAMFTDKFEFRVRGRYTSVGKADLSTGELDDDTLYGIGFGYEIVRGLSLVGDFESGEYSSWNLGFRMDLSED